VAPSRKAERATGGLAAETTEERTLVYSECLPVSRVPHSTPLFAAYLHEFSRVASFFSHPPFPLTWLAEEADQVRYDRDRRLRVAEVLERQNRAFNSGGKALANVERLRSGAFAAVTGQQVSLFGGPLFSILKALTAVRIAEEATRAGVDCVPLFWLATEDHDLAEVNHVVLPGGDGLLQRLETSTHAGVDTPVGQVCFGPEIQTATAQAAELLGEEVAELIRKTYKPGACFGDAFARLFAELFRDWGVVLLDASDGELHEIAAPLYKKAIADTDTIHSRLMQRGQELRRGGFHEQVKVTTSSTLLFDTRDHARVPIHRADGQFSIGDQKVTEADLLAQIDTAPAKFSPNVLLRPVVQDYLLPTIAYIGGPAEVAYFAQAAVVYEMLLGRVTPIVPRLAVTIVEPHVKRLLERYDVKVADVFQPFDKLREMLAERALPADLQANFDAASTKLGEALRSITSSLERLDPTLVEAAERAGAKMRYQLDHLRARAANAELRRSEVLARHAAQLSSALYPDGNLQERIIGSIYFQGRYPDLLNLLYNYASFACPDQQVLFL
jgi:bacillithiol biosynthesis cysteine-adding enzyme BshC